jgi:transcriptional antiterminator RfaH
MQGKRVLRQEALFSMYIFLKSASENPLLSKVPSTLGVRRLLYFGSQPAVVSTLLVDDLQRRRAYKKDDSPYKKGQRVALHSGPFKCYQGIFRNMMVRRKQ